MSAPIYIMKIQADVKITILDGNEKGRVFNFSDIGETETYFKRYGIIERIRLEWSHIRPIHVDDNRGISMEEFEEAMKVLKKEDV